MFDFEIFASALGWVGAALSLLSYVLVSSGRIVATSITYQSIVLVSASTLAFSTAIFGAWPSAVTNMIYIAIGVVTIAFIVWKRSGAVRRAVRDALRSRAVDAAHAAVVADMRARTAIEVASSAISTPRRRLGFVTVPKQRLLMGGEALGAVDVYSGAAVTKSISSSILPSSEGSRSR